MKFHGRWLAVTCLALAFTASHAGGQVYRWVDKQGRVHYGDRPPANAAPAKVRAIPVPVEPSAMARLRVEPGDGVVQVARMAERLLGYKVTRRQEADDGDH